MSDEQLDDEIPSPPAPSALVSGEGEAQFSTEIDADLFNDVPKMGDAIPIGTYDFKLKAYKKFATAEGDNKGQPNFNIQWSCQEEPYTGRVVFENCPWVKDEDVRAAVNATDPRRSEAKRIINNRLPTAKEIMEAAQFKPSGKFGFEEFLASKPEMKLQLKIVEKKSKVNGKYVPNGEMGNDIVKHLSKARPA